jgi:hypothetical protein
MKQCMEENYFKFRNQIYKQTEGTCMGSCLSPFIANVFMRTFETNLKSSPLFPRIWLRYVDDIFAVTKREKVNETLTWLNSQHPKIQFTFEIEENGRIPFLDVMVERSIDRLVFDVYRKPTSTQRYITADSYHPQCHKNAAFNSMAHRMCNFQLSPQNYENEKKKILEIGRVNGYPANQIQKIIRKHEDTTSRRNLTTLSPIETKKGKRISILFYPGITNKIGKVFKRNDIQMVCSSSQYKLKKKLGSTKDTRPTNEKSGIYEIHCGTRNCGYKYIGQTRRSIKTRFKEHLSHTNNDHIDLSSVAHHMKIKLRGGRRLCVHKFDVTNLKLLKNVTDSRKLDAYESIFLFKNKKKRMMNDEQQAFGNIQSPLFKLLYPDQSNR